MTLKAGHSHGSALELLLFSLDVTFPGDSLIVLSLWSSSFLAHGSQFSSLVLGPTVSITLTSLLPSSLVYFSPNVPQLP